MIDGCRVGESLLQTHCRLIIICMHWCDTGLASPPQPPTRVDSLAFHPLTLQAVGRRASAATSAATTALPACHTDSDRDTSRSMQLLPRYHDAAVGRPLSDPCTLASAHFIFRSSSRSRNSWPPPVPAIDAPIVKCTENHPTQLIGPKLRS